MNPTDKLSAIADRLAETLPKGANCPKCKHFERFTGYVYAHWDIVLTGECEKCGHKFKVKGGRVISKTAAMLTKAQRLLEAAEAKGLKIIKGTRGHEIWNYHHEAGEVGVAIMDDGSRKPCLRLDVDVSLAKRMSVEEAAEALDLKLF